MYTIFTRSETFDDSLLISSARITAEHEDRPRYNSFKLSFTRINMIYGKTW